MSAALKELLKIARASVAKRAFTDAATAAGMPPGGGGMPMDPAMMGGGGGMPMDPSMMGGMPPDPSMMGGGAGGGVTADEVRSIVMEAVQQSLGAGAGAGGAAGAGGMLKPKIDVNVELMQIKNMLAKIVDALGIPVPAQDMVATPEKLTQMAMGGGTGGAGGGEQGMTQGAIPPIEPMQGAAPTPKTAADFVGLRGRAEALARLVNKYAVR